MEPGLLDLLARASTPAERIMQDWLCPDPTNSQLGGQRLARWLATACGGRPERAAQVLAARGISIDDWLAALSGVRVQPGGQLPPWVTAAGELLALADCSQAGPAPALAEVVGEGLPDWVDASQPWRFHSGFAGWWARADELVAAWCAEAGAALEPAARRDLCLWVVRRMLAVAGPTLMSRAQGELLFADPTAAGAQWRAIWETAPVLPRLLGLTWLQWQQACRELVTHIAADLPTLPGQVAPQPVARISTGVGDQHAGGRCVAVITLADATRFYVKPYPDLVTGIVASLLADLDTLGEPLGLSLPRSHERAGWTWVAGVEPAAPGMSSDDLTAWVTRAGALLRVLQGLGATDCHHENLICTPAGPVLVDLETALGPGTGDGDALARQLAESPAATAMITSPVDGPPNHPSPDIGGLAGPGSRPTPYPVDMLVPSPSGPQLVRQPSPLVTGTALPRTRHGQAHLLGDHLHALSVGYVQVQRRLAALADPGVLLGQPDPAAAVRFVPRPTQVYARLLAASLAGPSLSDGAERELVLERLWLAAADPALITAEQDALRDLDVPRFTVPVTRDDVLIGNDGQEIPVRFSASPRANAAARLRAVGQEPERLAEMRAVVFAADPRPGLLPASDHPAADPVAVLVAQTVADEGGNPAWVGLELDPSRARWSYRRLGPGLLGAAGVALALALAGPPDSPPAQLGVQALRWCARTVRQRPTWTSQDAHTGPSGVLWGLAVAHRAGHADLLREAQELLGHVMVVARSVAAGDLPAGPTIDGIAGAVLAICALPGDPVGSGSGTGLRDRDDLLVELASLLDARPPAPSDLLGLERGDPAARWIASLPSPAAGRLLARTRLAELGVIDSDPPAAQPGALDPSRWGDAAALADTGNLREPAWLALQPGPGVAPDALDLAAIAAAGACRATRTGNPDPTWQQRCSVARAWAQQQPGPAAPTKLLSAIHGTAALAILDPGRQGEVSPTPSWTPNVRTLR